MIKDTPQALSAYQRMRRLMLAVLMAVGLVGILFVGSRQNEIVHEQIEAFGRMLILIGIGGRLWSTLYIGGHKAKTVIDTGPYSVMRNPLYFFSSIAAAGVGAQTGSFTLTIVFWLLCWIAFTIVTLREERWLAANLGAPFLDYMKRVPRFFPNPMIYRDQAEMTFKPKLLNRTWLDGLVFFLSVPVFEVIEAGQEAGIIPVLAHLW